VRSTAKSTKRVARVASPAYLQRRRNWWLMQEFGRMLSLSDPSGMEFWTAHYQEGEAMGRITPDNHSCTGVGCGYCEWMRHGGVHAPNLMAFLPAGATAEIFTIRG
jgi:hypothetical protein